MAGDDAIALEHNGVTIRLEFQGDETFAVPPESPNRVWRGVTVQFSTTTAGQVTKAAVSFDSTVPPLIFERATCRD